VNAPAHHGDARDFDFLFGAWRIHNRRLVDRLAGAAEWQSFEARCEARALPGGIGNVDSFEPTGWRDGYSGATIRLFDPQARQWSIYWVDNASGILQPPVVGGFDGGPVGIFEGPDTLRGMHVDVRFTWTRIDSARARWEQAFSGDGGVRWETNWTMDLRRDNGSSTDTA
jgi:hypothetical protein